MRKSFVPFIAVVTLWALPLSAQAREVVWSCPDGEFAKQAINSGEVQQWPYFSAGPGMRVQKQHPNTAVTGQAKYLESNGKTGAVCQYYNTAGFVFTIIAIGAKKYQLTEGAYWRKEYTEPLPENDDPNNLMTDVCMIDKSGSAHMSIGCTFAVPEN